MSTGITNTEINKRSPGLAIQHSTPFSIWGVYVEIRSYVVGWMVTLWENVHPEPGNHDFLWRTSLCEYNSVWRPKSDHPEFSGWALDWMTAEEKKTTEEITWKIKAWSSVATTQGTAGSTGSWERQETESPTGSAALLAPRSQTSGCQAVNLIDFCCFKPPSHSWSSVTAATGNEYKLLNNFWH